MSQLSPTAHGILDAARRLLVRDGFAALSLEKIAAEAGVPKSLIRYHFGNKAGLIEVLVGALIHDANLGLKDELERTPAGGPRAARLLAAQRAMSADRRAFRVFYDVLPNALRDRKLRDRVARLYDRYRSLDAWALRAAAPPLDRPGSSRSRPCRSRWSTVSPSSFCWRRAVSTTRPPTPCGKPW